MKRVLMSSAEFGLATRPTHMLGSRRCAATMQIPITPGSSANTGTLDDEGEAIGDAPGFGLPVPDELRAEEEGEREEPIRHQHHDERPLPRGEPKGLGVRVAARAHAAFGAMALFDGALHSVLVSKGGRAGSAAAPSRDERLAYTDRVKPLFPQSHSAGMRKSQGNWPLWTSWNKICTKFLTVLLWTARSPTGERAQAGVRVANRLNECRETGEIATWPDR